jgi:hypothetical protein
MLRNLHLVHNTAGNGGSSITYTVRNNNVDTAITIGPILGNNVAVQSNLNAVAVVAGDKISVKAVVTGVASGNVNVVASVEVG